MSDTLRVVLYVAGASCLGVVLGLGWVSLADAQPVYRCGSSSGVPRYTFQRCSADESQVRVLVVVPKGLGPLAVAKAPPVEAAQPAPVPTPPTKVGDVDERASIHRPLGVGMELRK